MALEFKPYDYQKAAIGWMLDHPRSGIFLDMGMGKTVCALTAVDRLMYDYLTVDKTLVIAPPAVADTVWEQEAGKWTHLQHLRVIRVLGTPKQRLKALQSDADVYVVSMDSLDWLVGVMGKSFSQFDLVILDELSGFKNRNTNRFRFLSKVIHYPERVIGLTGTPAARGYLGLWSQMYLFDFGERLGKRFTEYRRRYFTPGRSDRFGRVYEYFSSQDSRNAIMHKLDDLCISMKKEDYLDMPDFVSRRVDVELPPQARAAYDKLERESVLILADEGIDIFSKAAAPLLFKLQQMAGGAVYGTTGCGPEEKRTVATIHDAKLEALDRLVDEANGQPLLVFIAYRHEYDRIKSRYGDLVHQIVSAEDVEAWNRGDYPMVVAHPASIGHGLNLQYGGHMIVWFGLTWSLELYQQANNRLYRVGQKDTVTVFHLCAKDTVEEACLKALTKKEREQTELLNYLSVERQGVIKEELKAYFKAKAI